MATKKSAKSLSATEQQALLSTLKARFEKFPKRHPGIPWAKVEARLLAATEALWSLRQMEETGGEPDVVALEGGGTGYTFIDCASETPKGRRSICYDQEALDSRKENKPAHSAVGLAEEMGVEVLSEDEYRALQRVGPFDQKTSSWVKTPPAIRKLDGAIFCDYRYGTTFMYHNGAESYYGARSFRGLLRV